ncbi:MAG: hypothetical protein ACTHOP_00870 [Mesorhizobium sp.]
MTSKGRRLPATRGGLGAHVRRPIFQRLRSLKNEDSRNLVRGILAQNNQREATIENINAVRRGIVGDDLTLAVTLLLGKEGAYPFPNTQRCNRDLISEHSLSSIPAETELAFLLGHLNGWQLEVLEILGAIATYAALPKAGGSDALQALRIFAKRWGASNYLSKKVAYVMATHKDEDLGQEFEAISSLVDQKSYPAPYFAASEAIDSDISYFTTALTRVQSFRKYVGDDFRKILPLHNIVASPISKADIGPFLRKCHSMSLVDEVVGLLQLMHLSRSENWEQKSIRARLLPELHERFLAFTEVRFDESDLVGSDPEHADLEYYRNALAFVEFSGPAQYRDYVDRIAGGRILKGFASSDGDGSFAPNAPQRRDLTKSLFGFRRPLDFRSIQNAGSFLRSIAFLRYVDRNEEFSALTQHDVRFIFEHTTALDVLLTEQEIETLYATVDEASRPLVTILALALHKAQSHSDDVDFKFRQAFCQTIQRKFSSNIIVFFDWLLAETPEIANFMLGVLDRSTLQKLYWIITSADEADLIRQKILRAVGKNRHSIEYFVEADSIEAQRQVSRLRKYFDDSRIFVDSIAMKNWLVENPNAYAQQYLRLIDHGTDTNTNRSAGVDNSSLVIVTTSDLAAAASYDYILIEAAKTGFEQFCTNAEFGIESYLGRRIRHNTLSGVMRGGVETIADKYQYRALAMDQDFSVLNDSWKIGYRNLIDEMRKEYLQFRTASKPRGLFKSEINTSDETTMLNIFLLKSAVVGSRGHDLFYELIIRFCWREIDRQLISAAQTITSKLLTRATDSIESVLGNFPGLLCAQYRAELRDAVHDRFVRLASWFRQPESGFVSASTKQLGNLVLLEAQEQSAAASIEWEGNGVDEAIDGLSVHRMYDCLSVLVRNALQYASHDSPIRVAVVRLPSDKINLARLEVTVTSSIAGERKEYHLNRLSEAFRQGDLDASMLREGYSGIKKLRYIVARSEGKPSTHYRIQNDECLITFALTVELASDPEAIE